MVPQYGNQGGTFQGGGMGFGSSMMQSGGQPGGFKTSGGNTGFGSSMVQRSGGWGGSIPSPSDRGGPTPGRPQWTGGITGKGQEPPWWGDIQAKWDQQYGGGAQPPQGGGDVTRQGSRMMRNGQVVGHYGNKNEEVWNQGQGPSSPEIQLPPWANQNPITDGPIWMFRGQQGTSPQGPGGGFQSGMSNPAIGMDRNNPVNRMGMAPSMNPFFQGENRARFGMNRPDSTIPQRPMMPGMNGGGLGLPPAQERVMYPNGRPPNMGMDPNPISWPGLGGGY